MISISCSTLERARKNHALFAELLIEGDKIQTGGTFGMFSHWQEAAKKFHMGELGFSDSLKYLTKTFGRFADTTRNRDKQSYLSEAFAAYIRQHKLEKLSFLESKHQVKWQLIPQIRLTGLTPWVFEREGEYVAYFCVEKISHWQSELKHPLLQRYLAEQIIHCRGNQLSMGMYCLEEGKFEFRRYSPAELRNATQEAIQLFSNIHLEINRHEQK